MSSEKEKCWYRELTHFIVFTSVNKHLLSCPTWATALPCWPSHQNSLRQTLVLTPLHTDACTTLSVVIRPLAPFPIQLFFGSSFIEIVQSVSTPVQCFTLRTLSPSLDSITLLPTFLTTQSVSNSSLKLDVTYGPACPDISFHSLFNLL